MWTGQGWQTEKELQNWLQYQLINSGFQCQDEVETHPKAKTRADLVTPIEVIECKKVLTRDSVYQAHAQANMYAHHLGREAIAIVGQAPLDFDAKQSAVAASLALMTVDSRLSVYFASPIGLTPVVRGQPLTSIDRLHGVVLAPPSPTSDLFNVVRGKRQPIAATGWLADRLLLTQRFYYKWRWLMPFLFGAIGFFGAYYAGGILGVAIGWLLIVAGGNMPFSSKKTTSTTQGIRRA